MSMFDLTDEVAVVIGATGALGGACAQAMAEAGARVAVVGRSAERGEVRVKAITEAGGDAQFFSCDAMDPASLKSCHEAIDKATGAPTILLNAAGGNHPDATVTPEMPFEKIPQPAWAKVFDLNLVGGFLLPCQEFGPAMCERGKGSIINIASVTSHLPLSKVIAYSASKAAVLSATRFLAREWATQGVRVNSITPGFFPAEQNKKLLFNEDGTPSDRALAIYGHTPMGRFGDPSELAGAAVYLASEKAASFVTGSDIVVDGGFLSQTI
ncbi:MAG: SDR family oxidoreductase [Pedosphaera sp.]|nr:SDR family oxidoreductase [Pedosphaera sp.]